ncbi:MAG: sialidase family protein [Aeoliella sp.]
MAVFKLRMATALIALRAIAVCSALVGSLAQAIVITESKPYISPKGPYVTEEGSYHTFRIPGMVIAADGSVLTFAEGRRGDGSDPRRDDNAPMDMTMRRSIDNGQTWEDLVVLDPGFKASGAKVDFGDPTPVLDQTTGDIFLVYGQFPDVGSTTPNWGQDPDSADGNHVTWVQSSSDHGVTWSGPTQIDYPDEPSETADGLYWRHGEPGPGSGIQLQWQTNPALNGRLVIPAKRRGTTTQTGSTTFSNGFVYYSDDHGTTWQVGDVASAGGSEDEVVELTSGDLLLDVRGTPRTRFTSSNGGNSWSDAPDSDVPITGVDASIIRYSAVRSGDDRDRLLFSGPGGSPVGSGSGRSNQLVWTSYDEGQTFINPKQFNEEQAAYSVLAKLNDGTIAMIVETTGNEPFNLGQSYGDITYYNFDLAELEGADHPATTSHYDGFGNQVDAFRGGVGWSGAWSNSDVVIETGGLEFVGFLTEGDQQHAHLRNADMTRELGVGALDLNQDQDFYFSVFVNHDGSDGIDSSSGEFLDVLLQDGAGVTQAAFGVSSGESFFVNDLGDSVASGADELAFDTTYLILAKLAAQDDSTGGNFDQLFLAWYDDPSQVPSNEAQISWQLVGDTTENFDGMIEKIVIGGGDNADWLVDGLRMGTTFDSVIVDTGIVPFVLGDITRDGLVNQDDVDEFVANWRTSGWEGELEQITHGDLNNDSSVNLADAFILHGALEQQGMLISFETLTGTVVPEPNAGALLLVAGLLSIIGRWNRCHSAAIVS